MATITYADKVTLNENADVAAINKCQAADMNEIKAVINETILGGLGLDTDNWVSGGTYNKGDIVIDDNNLYENITGTNTTTQPSQDTTNWTIVPILVSS